MHKLAIIFPGQGSQYVGMGKQFYDQFSIARNTFEEANEALGFDLKKLCFRGSFGRLSKVENIQPAILTVSVAAFRVFMNEIGLQPDLITGHSFGELSALVCAEAVSFETALHITKIKAKAVNEAILHRPTGMAAVSNIDLAAVKEICESLSQKRKMVVIAAVNSSKQTVISGDKDLVKKAGAELVKKGGRVEELYIEAAFHSPILSDAAQAVRKKIKKLKYSSFKYPVYSGLTLEPYRNSTDIINNLSWQLTKSIQWRSLISLLHKKGVSASLEIGPRTMLADFIKNISDQVKTYTFNKTSDLNLIKKEFGLNKENKIDFIINCLRAAVCTRNNNQDEIEYEDNVVLPYNKIHKLLMKLEEEKSEPSNDSLLDCLRMFNSVMAAKNTPAKEINKRCKELFYNRDGVHLPHLEKIIKLI